MQRRTLIRGAFAVAAGAATAGAFAGSPAGAAETLGGGHHPTGKALVLAHRGASGYRPEHTLEAYRLAIRMGADVIEPDLVPTKDGVLVARHEPEIGGTTDVADHPEFADRKTTRVIDGTTFTGWFTTDFTLAELKTLRAKERLPDLRPANTAYDGLFEVPTLQEVIDLARKEGRRVGRKIGLYPETKHPTYFRSIGLPLEEPLARVLRKNHLDGHRSQVWIQSFERDSLLRLNELVGNKLFFVTQSAVTDAILDDTATYAHGISLTKNLVIPRDSGGNLTTPTDLVARAHTRGLKVHAWTFRNENSFLPANLRSGTDPAQWGDYAQEYALFLATGIDGVFSDFPDKAVEAREASTS